MKIVALEATIVFGLGEFLLPYIEPEVVTQPIILYRKPLRPEVYQNFSILER